MKKLTGMVAVGVVVAGALAGCGVKAPEQAAEAPAGAVAPASPKGTAMYECPMCKTTSDKPGKCPKCGMAMAPKEGKK